jgi:hypothetical protein
MLSFFKESFLLRKIALRILILTLSASLVMICSNSYESTAMPKATERNPVAELLLAAQKLKEQKRPLSVKAEMALNDFKKHVEKLGLEEAALCPMADQLTKIANEPDNDRARTIEQDIDDNIVIVYQYVSKRDTRPKPGKIGNTGLDSRYPYVSVKTLSNGKEESGWRILFMEYFFRSIRDQVGPDSFPKLSSPSETLLPPGRFIIEARSSDGKRGGCVVATILERTTVEISVSAKEPPPCY